MPALFEVHDVSLAASGDDTGGRAFVARACGRMPAHSHCRNTRATLQQDYSTTTCVCACVSAHVCTLLPRRGTFAPRSFHKHSKTAPASEQRC